MAFTVTARHTANSLTTSSQNKATNSTTPTANSLFVVAWASEHDTVPTAPSFQTPTGGSLTYTQVAKAGDLTSYPWNGDDSFRVGGAVYRAPIGASPSAFAVTVDSFSGTQVAWYAAIGLDITGHDTTTPIVGTPAFSGASKSGGNTETGTVVLGATPTAGNLIVVMFGAGADGGGGFASPTAGAGKTFTTVTNQTTANCQAGVFYRVADGTESTTITCSDLGQTVGNYTAIAFEVAAASGGTNASAGNSSGTGAAQDPTRSIATGSQASTGTGTANAPSPSVAGSSSTATGTGAANPTTSQVKPGPSTASATGTANNATVSTGSATNAAATTASGTGVANAPSPTAAPVIGTASATGAAQNTTSKVSPSPTMASGTGVANNATIQTGSFTNAAAGIATGTGVAQQPSAKINVTPTVAAATGVANNPSAGSSISAQAGLASATGTASNPTVTRSTSANAGVATGAGSVSAARWSLRATANAAVAIAAAYDALIAGAETNARSTPSVAARRVGIATVEGESDTAAVTSAQDSSALVSGRTSIPSTTSRASSNSSVTE